MSEHGRRWVQASVIAAGLGAAAVVCGTEVPAANPGESGGSAAQEARSQRTAVHVAPARTAAGPAVRGRPARMRAAAEQRMSSPVATATPAVTSAVANFPPGPIQAAILAAQAYIYGYPLMEYERVRAEAPSLNTLLNLTSFASPDVDPIWKAIGGRQATQRRHVLLAG